MKIAVALCSILFATISARAETPANLESLGQRLVSAVSNGDAVETRRLLAQWESTGKFWPTGHNGLPLIFLAIDGRAPTQREMIELLLANGAPIQSHGSAGMTALHWAAWRGSGECTAQLLQHKAQVEAKDNFGRTPLHVARGQAVEKLLAAHAVWIALDDLGNTPMHYAAEDNAQHLDALFRAGFNVVDARNNSGLTPLHFAALAANNETARWLLDHGANPNAITAAPYVYTPLESFAGRGKSTRVPAGISVSALAAQRGLDSLQQNLGAHGGTVSWRPTRILQVLFALFGVGFFWAFILGIFFLDARITGWHAIAEKFPALFEPANVFERQDGGVGTIGLVYLRSLLRAAATDDGLYLAFPKFLAAGHAPLLIPWSQLRVTKERTALGIHVAELQVGEPKIARLVLRGGIAKEVSARLSTAI